MIWALVTLLGLMIGVYIYWRFFFFFRDPERKIPKGDDKIVAPADGTIIYIKKVYDKNLLFSTKKKNKISLKEFCNDSSVEPPCYLIGTFMHPTSVHVNRSPISGVVKNIEYKNGKNLPLTITWWRVNLKIMPFEKYASHLFTNERNMIKISGKIDAIIVQIADIYVNKIECWINKGDKVLKGQRIGMIKLGSQVDLLLPLRKNIEILVKEGEKVRAGETIIGRIT